ncbi:30S ribosomal protein S13 [Candidatus Woesearchaeota archaeon]|nr:30S ribosomal protein S13 [Candidatus Woesearchaeota archaeon]
MTETDPNFKYIVRIANTDLNGNKALLLALRKIKGVNFMFSNFICKTAKISIHKKTGLLSDEEVKRLDEIVLQPKKYQMPFWLMNRRKDPETGEDKHLLTGDLQFSREQDIKIMKKIKSYKGIRHHAGLTVRGQRTKSNFRKNKGKVKGVAHVQQPKKTEKAAEDKKGRK